MGAGLVVVVGGGVDAVRAARSAAEAAHALAQARAQPDLAPGALDGVLERAHSDLDRAQTLLERPLPRALSRVPVLGRSLDVERAAVQAGRSSVQAARVLAAAAPELRGPAGLDVPRLRRLARELELTSSAARDDVRHLAALPLRGTPSLVARTARDARQDLGSAVRDLRRAAVGADLAARLLGEQGPRDLLIALQNNAELQGAGGYVSSVTTARVDGGQVALTPFVDVLSVSDPPERARRVPAHPELVEDYGAFLADTTLWRTWTMSPDVPQVAEVGARVAAELLPVRPDAVLLLDVPALAALAGATGGVTLDGERLSDQALVDALLVDAYAAAGEDDAEQVARRRRLQDAATSALQTLLSGADPATLLPVLGDLTAGRHLALWSAVPHEQRAVERLGLSGALGVGCADLVSVNINSLNANKLDQYVDREVAVSAQVHADSATVEQRVVLRNRAPEDLVEYVAGYRTPGEALERVEFSAGPRAEVLSVTLQGRPAPATVRRSADRLRVATTLRLGRGDEAVLVLRYRLPRDGTAYRLHLVPQPLVRPARIDVSLAASPGAVLDLQQGALRAARTGWEGGGDFATSSVLEVRPRAPRPPAGLLSRLRDWWDAPVGAPVGV